MLSCSILFPSSISSFLKDGENLLAHKQKGDFFTRDFTSVLLVRICNRNKTHFRHNTLNIALSCLFLSILVSKTQLLLKTKTNSALNPYHILINPRKTHSNSALFTSMKAIVLFKLWLLALNLANLYGKP